jgi:hypothetical protein
MASWRYRITVHDRDDILADLGKTISDVPPAIYCDDRGACYFDEGPNQFTEAIEHVLTEIGREGWELVHIAFRPDQMICFWKQPR